MNDQLLKKVKRIEISTRRMMDDFMSGGYKSHFKGQGVQFSEHRQYTPGDDVRHRMVRGLVQHLPCRYRRALGVVPHGAHAAGGGQLALVVAGARGRRLVRHVVSR